MGVQVVTVGFLTWILVKIGRKYGFTQQKILQGQFKQIRGGHPRKEYPFDSLELYDLELVRPKFPFQQTTICTKGDAFEPYDYNGCVYELEPNETYMFSLNFCFLSESKPIKATKRTRWTKNDFAYNDEAEERNYAQVLLSEDEADDYQEMPNLEEISDHSSLSESYDD